MAFQMTDEQAAAVKAWQAKYGKAWKTKLRQAWETGEYGRFPQAGLLQQLRNQGGPAWLKGAQMEGVDQPTTMRALIEELEGSLSEMFGRRASRGRDPYLMKAKYAGVDAKGTPFKKGEEVMYYPNTKVILAGANKDQAWRDFQAAVDDERFMSGGY